MDDLHDAVAHLFNFVGDHSRHPGLEVFEVLFGYVLYGGGWLEGFVCLALCSGALNLHGFYCGGGGKFRGDGRFRGDGGFGLRLRTRLSVCGRGEWGLCGGSHLFGILQLGYFSTETR